MEATEITTGTIEPTPDQGVRIVRPYDMAHKDFMLMQKAEWPEFHRVRIGRWKSDYRTTKEIEWWCNSNVKGRWFHSEGYEVYYFEDEHSSVHFKLRWFSEMQPE